MNDDDYFVGDAGEDYKVSFNRIINYDSSEFRRLILVENAVINYSGGVYSLIERLEYEINHSAKALSIGEKRLTQLLTDLKYYFRDVSCHLKR
ncbi:hypothetical protein [Kosakonia cowanii]|uniref:hypothetical protein n=1 Tax=Kosakonia cowanii TaxID=208223 RepID=UPI0028A17BCD|nr:hypothetical protein [Kosakonia cowanii]